MSVIEYKSSRNENPGNKIIRQKVKENTGELNFESLSRLFPID
jgi:hypothetical protein